MDLSESKKNILVLFNLEEQDIQDIFLEYKDHETVAHVLLVPSYPPCPECGCKDVKIKGYQLKKINHSVLTDRKCTLYYKARRYVCPACGRTFYEDNPFCFRSMKISALTTQNILKDLKEPSETFSSVARRYHISPTSAASIFDQHIVMPRLILPEYMCWDEAYAFHYSSSVMDSKYVFTILNFRTQEPIDMLPCRKSEYLINYFLRIPVEERKKVKMICTDMSGDFRSVIREAFPDVIHCADHYHVTREMNDMADKVRIRVMKSVKKTYVTQKGTRIMTNEYYLLKNFSWLLYKRPDAIDRKDGREIFDVSRERRMNHKLNRLLNYCDIRELMKAIHPDLRAAWDLKDEFVDFYDDNTLDSAPEALDRFIKKLDQSGINEMQVFKRTLCKWKQEIINSFTIVYTTRKVDRETGQVVVSAKKLNNGLMENRNSILKTIKKNANTYTNWRRFRNRCLYVLRRNAVPLLNPVSTKKVVKK